MILLFVTQGGLVRAGLEVAEIWLDGDETLVNAIDREGNMQPINMVNGHAITHDPLAVLVNEGSASASEILAGALHDNGRAILVGRKTFGKGRIQTVTELNDGSALFVTVAKYLSPALHDIDKVVETFTPGSFSRNGESSKRKSSARGRGRGSAGSRRGTKQGSRSAGSRLVEKGKTINEGTSTQNLEWNLVNVSITEVQNVLSGGEATLIKPWSPYEVYRGIAGERLDRAMVLGDWITSFLEAKVTNAPISVSDHGYVLLDTVGGRKRGFKPFRFFEAWSRDQSCEDIIKGAWRLMRVRGKNACGRLNDTRIALQKWKKDIFGECDTMIKAAEERLGWIQGQTSNASLLIEELELQSKISELWIRKESMWRQRGGWETSERQIGNVFNEFFSDLYNSQGTSLDGDFYDLLSPTISDEENRMMKSVPTTEEIWNVVAAMHPLKAPGPDGMPDFFYRRYWNVVGSEVIEIVQDFFQSGRLERHVNYTYICLIPKEENARTVDKFRPISLCNFAYKIIPKIFATRLREVIDKLISPFQSAFVPGRWIAESSILTQELVHTIKRKKGKGGLMEIKLDMLKAYDRIEWNFLQEVLKGHDFDQQVCDLIMECVQPVSYSVLINGVPQKKFFPKRGLRQGDPLSPFLFLLCHDVLSKLIIKQQARGRFHGISISRSAPAISHLMFADDTILFTGANNVETPLKTNILNVLKVKECDDRGSNVSEKYCKKDSFWSIQARDKYSAFWKGILGSADIIRKGAMTLVGRGDTIDIWKQPWIPWLDYCDFLNLMNQVRPRFPNLRSIADITLDNGNWNMTLLKEMFGDSVGDRIGRIARLPLDNRDVVVWKEANDGMFTVKRGFEASQGNGQRVESKLWKKIWSSSVHFRHSIMLWRVILDCLPTRERLVFLQDKTWSMCGEATKSNTHIFWDCPCARALWFSSPFSILGGIDLIGQFRHDRVVTDVKPESEHSASFLSFVGCLFKGIWKARNELLFKGAW
uniref:Reverse transcriptase domain-containing protein n=1 Tax=Cannabis sativa TaxID=3483 RepID=A0A803PHZ0_CANSA